MLSLHRRNVALASLVLLTAGPALGAGRPTRQVTTAAPQISFTFAGDIAPILHEHCAGCHHQGGSAPFSLVTYDEVRPRARQIAAVVRRRLMPPWNPEPGYGGPFEGERRLADDEIGRIQKWATSGAARGSTATLPPLTSPRRTGWQLGVPDVVVSLPVPYTVAAGTRDVLRNFVIPVPISQTRYVTGLEFQPSNRAVAHHANIRIDQTSASRRLDELDPEPGYGGITAPSAVYPDGHLLAWTPGQVPPLLRAGMAWQLNPGSSLVIQMHLMPTNKPEPILLEVGLYFTDVPPDRRPAMLRIGEQSIDIPAGETSYVVGDRYVLPVDVEVQSIQPHAHYLAKDIKGFVTFPDGTRRWLIYIKKWNFHWQDLYRYREPFWLPKGSTLHMEYIYDNSASNPLNPNTPPKRVRFGQLTTDEMGDLWIQVLTRDRRDRALLMNDYQEKESAEDIEGYHTMLGSSPDDASIHDGLANAYIRLNRLEEGTRHARESVRLQPGSSAAHYNLATALVQAGAYDEAAARFRQAIGLNPRDAFAHNGLGVLLVKTGRAVEAIEAIREALRLEPLYANAHNNLGVALQTLGRIDEAIDEYREAVRITPAYTEPLYNVAEALRLRGRFTAAVDAYAGILAIDPDHPAARFTLATTLEALGRYDQAALHYRRALLLNPNDRAVMVQLAWILAAAPTASLRDPASAVVLAESALSQAGPEPAILDVLAASYAASGRFDLAIANSERALRGHLSEEQATELRKRLTLYRQRRAYVASAPFAGR